MKTQSATIRFLLFSLLGMLLVGCGQSAIPPDAVVENYLAALVANDDVAAVNFSCAAWETNAQEEGASFEGVEVALQDVDCAVSEQDSASATVTCAGKIVFSYAGGEDEEIDLSARSFSVVLEGSEWRMCGYK